MCAGNYMAIHLINAKTFQSNPQCKLSANSRCWEVKLHKWKLSPAGGAKLKASGLLAESVSKFRRPNVTWELFKCLAAVFKARKQYCKKYPKVIFALVEMPFDKKKKKVIHTNSTQVKVSNIKWYWVLKVIV